MPMLLGQPMFTLLPGRGGQPNHRPALRGGTGLRPGLFRTLVSVTGVGVNVIVVRGTQAR
jgi:hypothetical protein